VAAPDLDGEALVLRGCRVLPSLDGRPVADELWIAGGRVVEPGSRRPGRSEVLRGAVVAPGLIDAHVHLCLDASPEPLASLREAAPAVVLERMGRHAAQTLWAGVTTVRDLGAPTALILALRDAIARGACAGPRIIASGAPLTVPHGHGHEMGGGAAGADAIRRAVRALARAGVDVVKVMATGGGSSPQTDPRACQFSDEEFAALAHAARRAGLAVAAHAHADAGIRQAVAAGVRSIEHGSYASEASLRRMAEQGVALVPTLAPALAALAQPLADARRSAIADRFEARRAAVRAAARYGVRIVAGTDAGVAYTPHGTVAAEIEALIACGLPVGAALAAAGREAASVLGCPDLGTLRPGAPADLVVLAGDPADDPGVLFRPLAVMLAGRWVRPPSPA
jgi:imidazolonepropionase-like amidohydrolase